MEETTSAEGDTRMIECTAVSKREGGERERCRGREPERGWRGERER